LSCELLSTYNSFHIKEMGPSEKEKQLHCIVCTLHYILLPLFLSFLHFDAQLVVVVEVAVV